MKSEWDNELICMALSDYKEIQLENETFSCGCYKVGHYILDCPLYHYRPLKSLVIQRHINKKQKSKSVEDFKRISFVRESALKYELLKSNRNSKLNRKR